MTSIAIVCQWRLFKPRIYLRWIWAAHLILMLKYTYSLTRRRNLKRKYIERLWALSLMKLLYSRWVKLKNKTIFFNFRTSNLFIICAERALRWRYEQDTRVCNFRLWSIFKTWPDRWGKSAVMPGRLGADHWRMAWVAERWRRRGSGADTHKNISNVILLPKLYKCLLENQALKIF